MMMALVATALFVVTACDKKDDDDNGGNSGKEDSGIVTLTAPPYKNEARVLNITQDNSDGIKQLRLMESGGYMITRQASSVRTRGGSGDEDYEFGKFTYSGGKYVLDNAENWGLSLSSYGLLWGHDAFYNKELIFGLGRGDDSDNGNVFEKANYPVGVENGSSGNCPTQSLVDQYEYQDNGETFGERHPGNIDLNLQDPYEGLDPRFALTVVKNGDEWPSNGAQKKVMETFVGGFNGAPKYGATPTSYYLRKYVDGGRIQRCPEVWRYPHELLSPQVC